MRGVEIEHTRCVRARGDNVGRAVAVDVAEREPIHRALPIPKTNARKPAASAIVDKNCAGRFAIPEHDVRMAVAVHVGDSYAIDGVFLSGDRDGVGKFHVPLIEVDKSAAPRLVANDDVQATVTI